MTDLFEAIRSQRACRDFSDEPVDDAVVARLLEAATHAPSAENRQPWVFIVVRDPSTRARLHDLSEHAWEQGGREFSVRRLPPRLLADVEHGIAGGGYRAAPMVVVVAADTTRAHPATIPASIFPAVQNLLLAAQGVGLGSALTTITTTFAAELTGLLGLPDTVVAQAVVPLGYPAKPLGPPRREPFAEHTYRDRYGVSW
jgi:nitroreductase